MACSLMACSSNPSYIASYNPKKVPDFLERTIPGDYVQVFKAAQIALNNYPIAISDMESGILKTNYIQNEQIWQPPYHNQLSEYRYTLSISILRVKNKKAIQITIVKDMEHKRNFISEYKKIKTDGLEELTILYRINREILFQRRLEQQHALDSKKTL